MTRKIVPTLLAASLLALLSACDPADNDNATADTASTTAADTAATDTAATTGAAATDSTATTAGTTDSSMAGTTGGTATSPTTTQADAAGAAGTAATFNCTDNTRLSVTYDADNRAMVAVNGGTPVTLSAQSGSTGVYSGSGYEFRADGSSTVWTAPGAAGITCTRATP